MSQVDYISELVKYGVSFSDEALPQSFNKEKPFVKAGTLNNFRSSYGSSSSHLNNLPLPKGNLPIA